MSQNTIPQKRPRGRPPGSGIDDSSTLAKVADMRVAESSLKPTAAIKRLSKKIGPSHLRRLQAKWKREGPQLMTAAHERVRRRIEAAKKVSQAGFMPSGLTLLETLAGPARLINEHAKNLEALTRALLPDPKATAAMKQLLEPFQRAQEAMRPLYALHEAMRPFQELAEQSLRIHQMFKPALAPDITKHLPQMGTLANLVGINALPRW